MKGAATSTAASNRCITANSIMMLAAITVGLIFGSVIRVSVELVNSRTNIAINSACTIGHTSAKASRYAQPRRILNVVLMDMGIAIKPQMNATPKAITLAILRKAVMNATMTSVL